jgi:hypothetical protein
MYEKFRPEISEGVKGWGAKFDLDPGVIEAPPQSASDYCERRSHRRTLSIACSTPRLGEPKQFGAVSALFRRWPADPSLMVSCPISSCQRFQGG